MFIKLLCVFAMTQALVAATPKKKASDERVSALLVKDGTNGELRFFTGTSTVNQLITQQQDLLEQLRPSSGANNNIRPIVIDLNGDDIQTTSPTVTNGNGNNNGVLGAVASQTSPIGALLPQIVGQGVAGGGNGPAIPTSSTIPTTSSPAASAAPATSSVTLPTSPTNNRRRIVRRGNKRRRVNVNSNNRRRRRRRPSKKNSKKQFVVVRPQRG